MSHDKEHRSVYVPEHWGGSPAEHLRKIALSVNQMLNGMLNNHYTVTLEANETETIVPFEPCRPGVSVLFSPRTSSAAAAMAAGSVWAQPESGQCRVIHDADPATDRVFSLVFVG